MELEHALKMTVSNRVDHNDGAELFSYFKAAEEEIVISLKQTRDRVIFTDKKIVIIDFAGLTEKKKKILFFPYRTISGFSLDTAGTFSKETDLILFLPNIGTILLTLGKSVDTKEVCQFLSGKIQ